MLVAAFPQAFRTDALTGKAFWPARNPADSLHRHV